MNWEFLQCIILFLTVALMQLLLVTQSSPCELQEVTQSGEYTPITYTTVYRPINATDFTVRCQCASSERVIPSWTLPNTFTITNSSGYRCLDVGICIMNRTLSFQLLRRKHSGYYECFVNSSSAGFMLHVIDLPILMQPQNPSTVPLGTTLQCRAVGEGSLKYYWERKRSGNWATVNSKNKTSYTTRNTGQYRCNVTNEAGSVLSPVITVYGPPNIFTHPSSHIVTVGMSVTLYCNASGFNVQFVWLRRTNGDWSSISNSQSYNYVVRNIQQYQQYRCVASNDVGGVTSNVATIQVLRITTPLHNKRAAIGSNVTLTCISSISSVTFTWTHNGRNIRQQPPINSYTSRLTIHNVTYRDGGRYVCTVERGSLSVTSNTATIAVYVPKPVITTHPTNAKVKALTSVTFTCSATDINGLTHSYSWYLTNGDIPSTRSRGRNTNTLTITRVIPPDEGMYYCIVTNDAGSVSSRAASLTVDDELSITVTPLSLNVNEGELGIFTATGSGIKTRAFKYEWFKNNGGNSTIVGRNTQLMIRNVKIKDQGTYFCVITNEWNNTKHSKTVHLIVFATSSTFTTHPQDQFVHINEDTQFECAANESGESLTINWIRNHGNIPRRFRISNENNNGVTRSVLKVKQPTVDDSGFYWCVATDVDNEVTSSKQAELLILPSMNTHPDNVTILSGQSVNLTCSATGTDIVYQWMRNGVIISDDNSNVLRINEITQSDDGVYQCIASNKGGNATSNPAMIIVYDQPSVNPLLPQILGVLGEQFQITCNATNDKDAPHNMIFTWATPDGVDYDTNLTSKDDDHTASSTLYISRLARSDEGTYKCHVTNNNIISVVTSTTVIVKERPSQPFNLNVINANTTSLALSWNEPENFDKETDYYIIYYSDDKTMKTISVFNFTGLYILHNLTSSTQYSIYVRAVRWIGVTNETLQGDSSVKATATTSSIVQECDDNDHAQGNVTVTILVVILVVSLICCFGLIIIVFKLYKKIIFLQEKIKSTDEKHKVPNPTYADLVVNSDDINMESNPAYQCSSKQDEVKDHNYYETIITDDKSAANKNNTASD